MLQYFCNTRVRRNGDEVVRGAVEAADGVSHVFQEGHVFARVVFEEYYRGIVIE